MVDCSAQVIHLAIARFAGRSRAGFSDPGRSTASPGYLRDEARQRVATRRFGHFSELSRLYPLSIKSELSRRSPAAVVCHTGGNYACGMTIRADPDDRQSGSNMQLPIWPVPPAR